MFYISVKMLSGNVVLIFKNYIYLLYVNAHTCLCHEAWGVDRENCRSRFSSSIMWTLGIELRSPGMAAIDFIH